MPAVYDQAKITVSGRPLRIEEGEPLEDSVRTVHSVMLMQAERGGEPIVHNGVKGLRKHLNLTRIVQALATDLGENDRKTLARLISQVFSKTGAAACLHGADPVRHKDPVWFVAYELPENYLVVVGHVRGRSAGTSSATAPRGFSEENFLSPREKKLRPEEVGEDREPGEVVVAGSAKGRRLNLSDEDRARKAELAKEIFGEHHEARRQRRDKLREQLHEFIVTAPVPMTAPEMVALSEQEFGEAAEATSVRNALRDLEQAGRISSRKETPAERLIRGGGHPVKATAPRIYGPPDGVPERTRLPKGIKPLTAAREYADERRRDRESLDERVYNAMDVPNVSGTGHGAPRTVHMIAKAADVSDREALEALGRLVAAGRVWYHPTQYYYTPMTRVRRRTLEKYADLQRRRRPAPEPEPEPVHQPHFHVPDEPAAATAAAPTVTAEGQRDAQALLDRVRAMLTPPDDEVALLRKRARQLESENAELREFRDRARQLFNLS